MHNIMSLNVLGIVFCFYFAYYLCYDQSVDAFQHFVENESDVSDSFEQPKIWSSLLEELTIKLVIFFFSIFASKAQ